MVLKFFMVPCELFVMLIFIAAKLTHQSHLFELCTFCAQQNWQGLQPYFKQYFYFVNLR